MLVFETLKNKKSDARVSARDYTVVDCEMEGYLSYHSWQLSILCQGDA